MTAPLTSIIIVGAGPAGLVLALLLAKSGIDNLDVRVLEREASPPDDTRAVFYQPVSFFEFQRAGIMEDVKAAAFEPRSVGWRDMANHGTRLFGLPAAGMLALTPGKLAAIARRHLELEGQKPGSGTRILWSHKVISVGQDASKAWVEVETPQGPSRLEAQYIVGCDGANSQVRRSLFGEHAMQGFTWDNQLVAADIRYDFASLPDLDDSNIFMHPQDAWLAFRPSREEGLWRVIYSEKKELSEDELLAHHGDRLTEILPGNPSKSDYQFVHIQPYKIHQRCVEKMRHGRVVLASDAAHLCCPYGAFGLNGGIADVGSLFDCLLAMSEGKADDSILDTYSEARIAKWKTIIDPQSQGTMKFIFSRPEDVIPNHPFYRFVEAMKNNPGEARKNAPNPLALRHDFSSNLN